MSARLVPLGGLGEFGANSMLLESGDERMLIDAGAAFSDLEAFGVGYEVPDYGALEGPSPHHVLFTHGHDDHLKALPLLLEAHPEVAVWGSRATLARARSTLGGVEPVHGGELSGGKSYELGAFRADVLPVSHSIPGTVVARLVGEAGTAVVATDLRLAPSALGEETPAGPLAAWGSDGVDVALVDATNALVDRNPPSETEVAEALTALVRCARGAVVAVSFASHVGRFRQLARAALDAGRVVVPVGRGMLETLDVQATLGGLDLPPGLVRRPRELAELDRDRLLLVATGSQGDPMSAFARLAVDLLGGFKLQRGDTVLHAARVIPGSEHRLAHLFDHCVRRGARVITAAEAPIHASGHAHRAELAALLDLLRPRWVLPIHGRRRNLEAVAELALDHGARTVVVENGEELEFDGAGLAPSGAHRGVGRILLDDISDEALDPALLRSRRVMAQEGVVVAVLACRRESRAPAVEPQIRTFGLDLDGETLRRLSADLAAELCRGGEAARTDPDWLRSTMSQWLKSELRRRLRRRPAVVALVMEF